MLAPFLMGHKDFRFFLSCFHLFGYLWVWIKWQEQQSFKFLLPLFPPVSAGSFITSFQQWSPKYLWQSPETVSHVFTTRSHPSGQCCEPLGFTVSCQFPVLCLETLHLAWGGVGDFYHSPSPCRLHGHHFSSWFLFLVDICWAPISLTAVRQWSSRASKLWGF